MEADDLIKLAPEMESVAEALALINVAMMAGTGGDVVTACDIAIRRFRELGVAAFRTELPTVH